MRAFVASLLVLSTVARADSAACLQKCAQYVNEPRICQRCPIDEHRGDWVMRLTAPIPTLWLDPDWEIRWASLRLSARAGGPSAERRLTALTASSEQRQRACLTALHLAGQRKITLTALLAAAGDPSARTACVLVNAKVIEAVQVDLFDEDPSTRSEALHHLAAATGSGTGRVVLDALSSRPALADGLAARLLTEDYERTGVPAGFALLRDAGKDDTDSVNRLLAVYSGVRDTNRAGSQSTNRKTRTEAQLNLRALAPLSSTELTFALDDAIPELRAGAARAIAAGEGRTLAEATRARIEAVEATKWLALLGETRATGCAAVASGALAAASITTRTAALNAYASCEPDGPKVLAAVSEAAVSPTPELRAAALRAGALLRAEVDVSRLVKAGLRDPDETVLLAGLQAAATMRLRAELARMTELATHSSARVRLQAMQTVMSLEVTKGERLARSMLENDPVASVREGAVVLLGEASGGPATIGALVKAAKNDSEARVKLVAAETLRRLGVGQPRSINP